MRIDSRKKLLVIIITAIVLYGLSELSSYLKQEWFPLAPSIIVSEEGNRGLRISESGKLQTAILKPLIKIKTAQLKDSRNHPNFQSSGYPYLYNVLFSFDVINGIENKNELLLSEVILVLDANDSKFMIERNLYYRETIKPNNSENISTNAEKPIFLGYKEEVRNCKLSITCKFENYDDLHSKAFSMSID